MTAKHTKTRHENTRKESGFVVMGENHDHETHEDKMRKYTEKSGFGFVVMGENHDHEAHEDKIRKYTKGKWFRGNGRES